MRFVFVPGIGGSDEGHWQSLWERELGPAATRIAPASWTRPDPADWRTAIAARATRDAVLVGHSLGCLAVATWLASAPVPAPVAGAFLVAPPDPGSDVFPAAAAGFRVATDPLGVPAVVLASRDDPYADPRYATEVAERWGATLIRLGPLGHVNTASGLGRWPAGRDLLAAFTAGLARPAATGAAATGQRVGQ